VGYEMLPRTNGKIPFNMNNYCTQIFLHTQSNYDKMGLNKTGIQHSSKKPFQFANFVICRSQNYPEDPQLTPFPSNEELFQYLEEF
jgi:hypothetical protein